MVEQPEAQSFDLVAVERDPPALALVRSDPLEVMARIPLSPHPASVAVRADRRFAYVVHDGPDPQTEVGPPGRLLTIVDLVQRSVAAGQDLGRLERPVDVAADAAGGLALLVAGVPTLLRGAEPNAGRYEFSCPLDCRRPTRAMPLPGRSALAVLDPPGARVVVVDPAGRHPRQAVVLPTVPQPTAAAVSPDGRWLAVGGGLDGRITRVDLANLVWYPAPAIAGPVADLAFDADGTLHAADANGGLWAGDVRGLEPAGAAPVRRYVRGRPDLALGEAGLFATADPDAALALARPVMALAVA